MDTERTDAGQPGGLVGVNNDDGAEAARSAGERSSPSTAAAHQPSAAGRTTPAEGCERTEADHRPVASKPVTTKVVIHPALYQAGFAAVGVVDNARTPWLIVKDRHGVKRLDARKEHDAGNVYPAPFIYPGLIGRWTEDDINTFLAESSAPTIGAVVTEVRNVLTHFLEFKHPEDASAAVCWIVGTYFHQVFPAFPRLNVHGERGSGKTKFLQMTAAMSFNGLLFIGSSAASLFRLIETTRATLCLDEMEKLSGDGQKAVSDILNAGYKTGMTVPRVEGDGDTRRVVGYEVYAPVAIAGISGINATIADRAITIIMERGTDPARINLSVDPRAPGFGTVRAKLYRTALTYHREVRVTVPEMPEWLQARQRELFSPLLAIAKLADGTGASGTYRDVLRVAARSVEEREALPEEGRALFRVLEERLGRSDDLTIYPKELAEAVSEEVGMNVERERLSAEKIGGLLRRYGFKRLHVTNKGTPYAVTREEFREKAARVGYPFIAFEPDPAVPTGATLAAEFQLDPGLVGGQS